MANELDNQITALTAEVTRNKDVEASAVALINGVTARIDAAVAAALAKGATPEELQAVTDLNTSLKKQNDDLAAAVVANTPAA